MGGASQEGRQGARIREISVAEVGRMLKSEPGSFRLLDVREDFEIQIASIRGAEHLTEAAADELLRSGDREALHVFTCHHGVRSLHAAAFFAGQGFKNVASMTGGIHAWSLEIDPSVPTY